MSDPPRPPAPWPAHPVWWVIAGFAVVLGVGAPLLYMAGNAVFSSTSSSGGGLDFTAPALPAPPPAVDFGTAREIGTRGDDPNPRALYHGAYPSNDQTQERRIGGPPARFSGYTTWVRSVARVPARPLVDGYTGEYLRVHVTLFNRDTETQHVCACDFYVYTRAQGSRDADVVGLRTLAPDTMMKSGARLDGNVYLYVGTTPGPFFVVYDPDGDGSTTEDIAKAVWRTPAIGAIPAEPAGVPGRAA